MKMQVQELEDAAARLGKSVAKMGRDIKHWEVWQWIKERIDAFKKTMPLISDLRNPAMRPRHWKSLMDTIQTRFEPASDNFTLDSIVQLRLDQHAEFIGEMSVNATKELAIEQGIFSIAETWKTLDLDMVRHLAEVQDSSTLMLLVGPCTRLYSQALCIKQGVHTCLSMLFVLDTAHRANSSLARESVPALWHCAGTAQGLDG